MNENDNHVRKHAMPKHQQYCQICMKGARNTAWIIYGNKRGPVSLSMVSKRIRDGCGFPTMGDEKIEMETRTHKNQTD